MKVWCCVKHKNFGIRQGSKLQQIPSDKGLQVEMSASLSLHGGNLALINLFDTKL